MTALTQLLATLECASPLDFALNSRPCLRLNLATHPDLEQLDTSDVAAFSAWITAQREQAAAHYAAGGYGENRALYQRSRLFDHEEEPRTLHLGIDLWLPAGCAVHAVIGGRVHSLADNARFGDYGPTVILQHEIGGERFYTLYGHLARRSLQDLHAGRVLRTGEAFGWLGEPEENVGWPPHLHFQIMRDLGGRRGDYPGVCRSSERAQWLAACPDPNLLLRIDALYGSVEP